MPWERCHWEAFTERRVKKQKRFQTRRKQRSQRQTFKQEVTEETQDYCDGYGPLSSVASLYRWAELRSRPPVQNFCLCDLCVLPVNLSVRGWLNGIETRSSGGGCQAG